MDTTKLTLFSLITKEIALKILTFLFLVCNIQVRLRLVINESSLISFYLPIVYWPPYAWIVQLQACA